MKRAVLLVSCTTVLVVSRTATGSAISRTRGRGASSTAT
jgi:hypothetical protein